MADDDRALMNRLAALEAEVKADADAQRARKEAALAELRGDRVTQAAERARARGADPVVKKPVVKKPTPDEEPSRRSRRARPAEHDDSDQLEDLGGALQLASRANRVKQELQRPRQKGDKSWIWSGVLSLTGPFGWLYAGSWREAVPAAAAWAAVLWLMPLFLMLPILPVVMPLSGIAGVVYALQYNRNGTRQRLFGDDKDKQPPKQLERG